MATTAHQLDAPPAPLVWRVAAPSLAVSMALLAVAALAATSLVTAHDESQQALKEAANALRSSAELETAIQEVLHRLTEYGLTGKDKDLARLSDLSNRQLVARIQLPPNAAGSAELRRMLGRLQQELNAVLAQTSEQDRREMANRLATDILGPNLLNQAAKQHDRTTEALAAAIHSNELNTWTLWMVVLLGITGAGAGALAGFTVARSLRQRLIELSVPIRTAAGSLDAVVGPVQVRGGGDDVEDLEESLNTLSGRVEEAVQRLQTAQRETLRHDQLAALGQLAAGLAHELRNPLTAIRTLVEVARERSPTAQLDGRDLEVVDEELTRLDATLQSFLDYARPPKLERREIDLRDVVRRTVQLVSPRADQQAVKLNVTLPAEPLSINADAEQLRQVLLNLLLNALDALGSGGQVAISARKDAAAGDLVLEVADNGPGIPESIRSTLFDPFVSSKPSGTGLGLTICRRIVENHGGTITANKALDGGAVFTIRLPLNTSLNPES